MIGNVNSTLVFTANALPAFPKPLTVQVSVVPDCAQGLTNEPLSDNQGATGVGTADTKLVPVGS